MMIQPQADHRDQMLALAREWRESGAPARVCAHEHGVTPWTLCGWAADVATALIPIAGQLRSRGSTTLALL